MVHHATARPKGKHRLLLLLLSFAALFGTGEVVVRKVAPQTLSPQYLRVAPWGIRRVMANVSTEYKTPEGNYEYNTNSRGFRGTDEYSLDVPEGTQRIAVQGDSMVLGHGVGDTETFAHQIQTLAGKSGKTEVINMAVPGFGTAEELIQFNNVAAHYNPNMVILGFSGNDVDNNHTFGQYQLISGELKRVKPERSLIRTIRENLYVVPGYTFLSEHSHLTTWVRKYIGEQVLAQLSATPANHDQQAVSSSSASESTKQNDQLTTAILEEYANTVHNRGALLLIVDIADRHGRSNFPTDLRLPPTCQVLRLKEQYRGDSWSELFIERNGNPNKAGHQFIAEQVFNVLSSQQLATN